MKTSKRMKAAYEKVSGLTPTAEPVAIFKAIKEAPATKFDQTVEVAVRLGINSQNADQQVRGTLSLPHGTGRTPRILVVTKGEKLKEAEDAGADFVGSDEILEKIQGGWLDFDMMIATPDMMPVLGKLGKVLGPRGLMPNAKSGTVTVNLKEAVEDFKKGRVEYRADKFGIVALPIGKVSFSEEALAENLASVMRTLVRVRPSSFKGQYVRTVFVSTTMGPSVKLDTNLATTL